ncbi:hypothetical protein CUMW_010340 [Citrus unshiu]|nr:hypothetical protein CUMW_010340 [Citrus unshiu]
MHCCFSKSGVHCTSAYIVREFVVLAFPVANLRQLSPEAALFLRIFNKVATSLLKVVASDTLCKLYIQNQGPNSMLPKKYRFEYLNIQ